MPERHSAKHLRVRFQASSFFLTHAPRRWLRSRCQLQFHNPCILTVKRETGYSSLKQRSHLNHQHKSLVSSVHTTSTTTHVPSLTHNLTIIYKGNSIFRSIFYYCTMVDLYSCSTEGPSFCRHVAPVMSPTPTAMLAPPSTSTPGCGSSPTQCASM